MNTAVRNILIILTIFITLTAYILFIPINHSITHTTMLTIPFRQVNLSNFLIYTEGCKIPKIDPYDPLIKDSLPSGSKLVCEVNDLVYAENSTIFLNWTVAHLKFPHLSHCKYDVIWRPPNEEKGHSFYEFVNESQPFYANISISEEYIRVQCYDDKNSTIYTNGFSFIQRKPEIEEKYKQRSNKHFKNRVEKLSILMLGVDSVSRSNMLRYMPETRSYLLHNMSAIELLGYNKIADNTFVNIVPMTIGKFVKEMPWTENMTNVPFDKYDFIWKKYSREGYRTLYIEDAPDIQIFDYLKAGFAKYPTDYFNRPFAVALEKIPKAWNAGHHCVHSRPETDIMLDYLKQFTRTFSSSPTFSFTFLTRLTHDSLPATSKADPIYRKFFEDLSSDSTLNNTVVIFFSDHGIRFGSVRETSVGRLEERLPFMFFIFPPWFLTKYPQINRNMRTNSIRLTTPFDIHETLLDLLNFKSALRADISKLDKRGVSLLNEVSPNRTCKDAEILPHWCTCLQHKVLSNTDNKVVKVAENFASKINEHLERFPLCANLSLGKVQYASHLVTSDEVLSYVKKLSDVDNKLVKYGKRVNAYVDYQMVIQTVPGNAVFEGTFQFDEGKETFKMLGDISRINKYGNQSHCVQETNVKKFCYCKDQIKLADVQTY